MSLVRRLVGMWVVGKTVSTTTPLLMRLMAGMAVMTLFAVFAAVLFAMLLSGLVWLGYQQLIAMGMPSGTAAILIMLLLLVLFLLVVLALQHCWRRATDLMKRALFLQAPVTGRLNLMMDSFLDGYNRR